jgi:hypothetical protein
MIPTHPFLKMNHLIKFQLPVVLTIFFTMSGQAATYGVWEYSVSNGSATITRYNGSESSVTIPKEIPGATGSTPVTRIGGEAFLNPAVRTVTIPYGVTSIDSYAFSSPYITNVLMPSSLTSIRSNAFAESGLTSVVIPDSVTSIGTSAFAYCNSLLSVTLPKNITRIEVDLFGGCSKLTSVVIPNGVTSIGGGAFAWCTSLSSITIPTSVTSIEGGAFNSCTSLTSVVIPNNVTSVGYYLFAFSTNLTSIVIGTGLTNLPDTAFGEIPNLSSVRFLGNKPSFVGNPFINTPAFTVYYHQGTIDWGSTFAGKQTALIPDYYLSLVTADYSKGTVANSPSGSFRPGSSVTLTATPLAGYAFTSWSGDSTSTSNPLSIEMNSNKTVMANFGPDTGDTDGDGLTNYQEVMVFNTNPNLAETSSPVAGLYLASQNLAERTAGRNDVINSPNSYSLYTTSQIQNMAVGDLVLTKNSDGSFTLSYDIEKSSDLQSWLPYQSFELPLTNLPPDKAFIRFKAKQ